MVRGDLSDADEYTNVHHHWQHGPSRAIGWLLSNGCYFFFLLVVGIGAAMSMYSIDTNAAGDNTHSALVFLNAGTTGISAIVQCFGVPQVATIQLT